MSVFTKNVRSLNQIKCSLFSAAWVGGVTIMGMNENTDARVPMCVSCSDRWHLVSAGTGLVCTAHLISLIRPNQITEQRRYTASITLIKID